MTTSKQKRGWIIWGVVMVIILLPLFYLGISFYVDALKYKRIENYYHENKESFNSIVEYYDKLYQENLYEVKYDCDNSYLECKLKYTNDSKETTYSFEEVDCTDERFLEELSKLREKYQRNCDYLVFSDIRAYYDNEGNMLLYVQAYNEKISTDERRNYYLVYIEEGYNGNGSSLGIDSFGMVIREPFTDNWYTWSRDCPFG